MNGYWMGLDIGGTKCAVLLAQMQQGITIVDKLRFDTPDRFQSAYDRLCEGVVTLLERHHLTREQIRGISISCGGPPAPKLRLSALPCIPAKRSPKAGISGAICRHTKKPAATGGLICTN